MMSRTPAPFSTAGRNRRKREKALRNKSKASAEIKNGMAKPNGVGAQQAYSCPDRVLGPGQGQDRSQDGSDAGRPAGPECGSHTDRFPDIRRACRSRGPSAHASAARF